MPAAGVVALFVLTTGVMAAMGPPANPPVVQEPAWDSPQTRALAVQAGCFDCHSNQTVWPWYTSVPILGQLVRSHVDEGREHFNLSRMDLPQDDLDEAGEMVAEGEMPPNYYTPLHPSARLTAEETAALIAGLDATFGSEGEGSHGERGRDHEDEDDED